MNINSILDLLTDKNIDKIKWENDDERFGALVMLTYINRKIHEQEKKEIRGIPCGNMREFDRI